MRGPCGVIVCTLLILIYLDMVMSQLTDLSSMEQLEERPSMSYNHLDTWRQHLYAAIQRLAEHHKRNLIHNRQKKHIGFAGLDNMDVMTSILEKGTSLDLRRQRNPHSNRLMSVIDFRNLMSSGK